MAAGVRSSRAEVSCRKWKIKERLLKQDIVKTFELHALHVLCLAELGKLNERFASELPERNVDAWILSLVFDSAVPLVRVYSGGHYA